jgi:hypothetical protein
MLQLDNQTPFKASISVLPDHSGIETLYVVVKATVTLHPALALADVQVTPSLADEYYGDPAISSLRAPSDVHIGKPGTDVLLIGSARAPNGRPTRTAQVAMAVADRHKRILVTGDRVWRDGRPSDPHPFESVPLVWERAFGGLHRRGERILADERNPVGCGFAGGRSAGEMDGLPVPNLEDPTARLEQLGQNPPPACLAPIAPGWLARRRFAGTYDERWQRSRAPYLPDDFDRRFLQCAAPEFAFQRYLQAGEEVEVSGVMHDGPIAFRVPDGRLSIDVSIAGSAQQPSANLETLTIEPDENRACFTWRAAVPCDRQALKVQRVVVRRSGGEFGS